MNMKFLAVVTPPSDIYYDLSTWKTLWEENFTPVNMTICGSHNIRKHRDINNNEQYIILDVYSKLYYMVKKEVASSYSRNYR